MSETDTDEPNSNDTETDVSERPDSHDPTDQSVRDLEVRVRDIENSIDQTESSLKGIQGTQEQLADDIDELTDTVRQLLDVYDQLTANSNPFSTTGDSFGVVGNDVESDLPSAATEGMTPSENNEQKEVVEFDDLHDELLSPDAEAPMGTADDEIHTSEPRPPTDGEAADVDRAVDPGDDGSTTDVDGSVQGSLDVVAGGYAGDLMVMEWLSMLIEKSGPASTLKTLGYYESIGWLSPAAREQLETYLSGPNLDVYVDPNSPVELTGEDHSTSRQYVRRLATLSDNTQ
ncbi:MAG: FlaD/FlaE family flagellar protein [Halovenus sp.]